METTEITSVTIRFAAMNLLAMREHSVKELKEKLTKKFKQPVDIDEVVAKLISDGLQSDERFTEAYIKMRQRQGKGAIAIKQELKVRGVTEDIINHYLNEVQNWGELALQVYFKKFGCEDSTNINEKAKRIRFLAARGFSADQIQYVFKQLKNP